MWSPVTARSSTKLHVLELDMRFVHQQTLKRDVCANLKADEVYVRSTKQGFIPVTVSTWHRNEARRGNSPSKRDEQGVKSFPFPFRARCLPVLECQTQALPRRRRRRRRIHFTSHKLPVVHCDYLCRRRPTPCHDRKKARRRSVCTFVLFQMDGRTGGRA